MTGSLRAALIQLNAGPSIPDNMTQAEPLIRAAAKDGARFILTPENTCRMRATREGKWEASYEQKDHPCIPFYAGLARVLGVHLLIGSLSSIRVGDQKLANRSFLFGPDGGLLQTYDKIHMFDVELPNGERYSESDTHQPGSKTALANLDSFRIGMTVCYDLRFPHLYRTLAKAGANILTIPSAFTVPTGQAHWEALLRARAIENGAYVLAPAQVGAHDGGRGTWGHSMAIDPWGQIISQIQDDKPSFSCFDLSLEAVEKARKSVPSLRHDRSYH